MDYIDRKRRGLERDAAYWTRQYHRTLSRLYVERERLAATPMTDPHAIRDLAGRVREHADLAVRLRRRRAEANLRLLAFDPDAQRRANKDVDGACRYLNLDGTRCGCPTVEGSRWCAGHVDRWGMDSTIPNHIVGRGLPLRAADGTLRYEDVPVTAWQRRTDRSWSL